MADIAKMSKPEATALAVTQDGLMQRAFIVVAKVLAHLQLQGKAGDEKPGAALVKAGVRKTTIDNARHAAKVWDLVKTGKLSEEKFDAMSRMDFVNFVQYATKPADITAVCAAKVPSAAVAKLIPAEVVAKKAAVKAAVKVAKKTAGKKTTTPPVAEETGEPETGKVTPIVAAVPSESDLMESLLLLEKGILARVAAGQDVGAVYTRIMRLEETLANAGVGTAPAKPAKLAKAA